MKFKNIPLTASLSITLLSWNIVAQADDFQGNNRLLPDNANPGQNWRPQQYDNNFWQTPNWKNFHKSSEQSQGIANSQAVNNSEIPPVAAQAPALQVPTRNEKSFVTESATDESKSTPTASNATNGNETNQIANEQNQARRRLSANGMPAMNMPPQMPGYRDNFRPPMPQGYYRPPYQMNPYQRPFAAPMNPSMQYGTPPVPPGNMYQGYRPPQNMNQPANPAQPQRNNRSGQAMPPPNYVPPTYNRPYNRNNNRFNNNNWGNNFWGRSGPGTWMNPNKRNMEQGWDDMINAPSRMGTMPGGWNAPEVTMPNPIDLGDQFQDNVQDLPEQLRNMDVGN